MRKKNIKEKLQSKVVWVAAIPLIGNLIAMYSGVAGEKFTNIATTVVTLLALFGILNNPNDKDNF